MELDDSGFQIEMLDDVLECRIPGGIENSNAGWGQILKFPAIQGPRLHEEKTMIVQDQEIEIVRAHFPDKMEIRKGIQDNIGKGLKVPSRNARVFLPDERLHLVTLLPMRVAQ